MRLNVVKHWEVTPKMLQEFELPITEENESDQSNAQRINEEEAYEYLSNHVLDASEQKRELVKQQVLSFPLPDMKEEFRWNSDFMGSPSRVSKSGAFSSNENLDYIHHVSSKRNMSTDQ